MKYMSEFLKNYRE